MTDRGLRTRRYLQSLLLQAVHYKRSRAFIGYIGSIESDANYRYIRKECEAQCRQIYAATMPPRLKEEGFDVVFHNIVMGAVFARKIYQVLREGRDPLMAERVDRTMGTSIPSLLLLVIRAWSNKFLRDATTRMKDILRTLKWNNNGVTIGTIKALVRETDYDSVIVSNKFVRIYEKLHQSTYRTYSESDLNPLFVLISDRYSVTKEGRGHVVEIPFQAKIFPEFSSEDAGLYREALSWARGLDVPGSVRGRIVKGIRKNFVQHVYIRDIAREIFGARKAKSLMTFAENEIEFRTFLFEAKKQGVLTIFYRSTEGIQAPPYVKHDSDMVLVCNHAQRRHFIDEGYESHQVKVIGSFNYRPVSCERDGLYPLKERKSIRVIFFTKGIKGQDEAMLDELTEKIGCLGVKYSLLIKKHPKDGNLFKRYKNDRIQVTSETDFLGLVGQSDLIVTQYGGVMSQLIPLCKPLIVYGNSGLLDYGEGGFFRNAQLPNYLKYVVNKDEFHQAIDQLLAVETPDPLPLPLAQDLYGYMDDRCGERMTEVIKSTIYREETAKCPI